MADEKKSISINDALNASKDEVKEWFREFVNPYLVLTLELVGFDNVYDKASGVFIYIGKKKYLDFLGGYGSVGLGHNHPKILAALENVKQKPNILQASLSPVTAALAKTLAEVTPGKLKRSFFCNSGAEAVEGALKIARAATRKKKIIYAENSFHGKTFGALSATGKEKYRKPFEPLVPQFLSVPFGDSRALEEALKDRDVAAFIVEPIQGEGGIVVPPDGYLKKAEELCRKYEALLIVDEIQTGLGRTGRMFACEYEGVEPDIICLGKALSGALVPIGVYITTEEVWERAYGSMDKCLLHTSTFGGNTWASTAALATLNVLCENGGGIIEEVYKKGERFLAQLKKLEKEFSLIKEVRGKGLMAGIEFQEPKTFKGKVKEVTQEYFASLVAATLFKDYQVLTAYTLNNPNVIRLEPPLTIKDEHLNYVVESLRDICEGGFSRTLVREGARAGLRLGKRLIEKIF